jgi:hypothetical protein
MRSDVKRLVFYIGGYDPVTPEAAYRRFVRELRRFAGTWSVTAAASEQELRTDEAEWRVVASGPNWRVATEYRLVRWDDVIAAASRQPIWLRLPLGLVAFCDFVAAGAFWAYLRTNWRYAVFFLYPWLLFAVLAAVANVIGLLIVDALRSPLVGIVVGALALLALAQWPGRPLYLSLLFDDWIFSRAYLRDGDPVLDARLERIAYEVSEAARDGVTDEIVIVGHSLGAVLAVDLLDRALKREPTLGRSGASIAFLSIGSSILKIGLHRRAARLRTALARVASAPGLFWAEYQALTDIMNFYKTDPMTALGLSAAVRPVVRIVRIREMLAPAAYRRIRHNFFRLHNQFVSANDRRTAYDYFMLLCGPLSVECQVRAPGGAVSAIGPDGTLLSVPHEPPRDQPARVSGDDARAC